MRVILVSFLFAVSFMAHSQNKVLLTFGGKSLTATLVENSATAELLAMLAEGDVEVHLSDYGGFEKVGALPQPLPASDSHITATAGDIMLYQGRNIVIFYGSNSWSYTRLGRIDGADADAVRRFLGSGDVTLTISRDSSTGVAIAPSDLTRDDVVYDLMGNRMTNRPLQPGIYIVNGRKVMIGN